MTTAEAATGGRELCRPSRNKARLGLAVKLCKLSLFALLMMPDIALARPRHHHHRHYARAADQPPECAGIPWCGCWLRLRHGLSDRSLNVAWEWARRFTRTSLRPGVIAVWRHHVGEVVAVEGDRILLLSGNDGRAVRERWRSRRGAVFVSL